MQLILDGWINRSVDCKRRVRMRIKREKKKRKKKKPLCKIPPTHTQAKKCDDRERIDR